MKAIQISQTGGVDVLNCVDVPKPAVAPGKVLVRNHFVGVNFIDTYHRTGLYKVELPFILGREASGVIEAVGEGVTGFKEGDRVTYLAGHTYAEYTVADPVTMISLPATISLEEGAAVLLQGATAMSLLRLVYEVKPGDYVLIHAAAGGTGQLLAQLAKHYGAYVIGTTSSAEKAETAKKAGADHVILYTSQDVVEEVKRITNGQGVHVVYDGVGKSTFDASLACLRKLGSMVSFGNASGKVDPVEIMKLVPRAVKLMRPSLFEVMKTREEFEALVTPLLKLHQEKKLSIPIHKIYPLGKAGEAHSDLEGKLCCSNLPSVTLLTSDFGMHVLLGRKTQGKLILEV
ncbi:NADPH:quinone reductase [Borealophlyctis nickersoniae]|nr:NADPH:quinone reductase [Borealophlyctis nickersoniae]